MPHPVEILPEEKSAVIEKMVATAVMVVLIVRQRYRSLLTKGVVTQSIRPGMHGDCIILLMFLRLEVWVGPPSLHGAPSARRLAFGNLRFGPPFILQHG